MRSLISHVDALIGNEEDLQKALGIPGPEVVSPPLNLPPTLGGDKEGGVRAQLDPDAFFRMIDRVVDQYPGIKLVGTTLREVHSSNRHDWAAVLWLNGERFVSPTCRLDVLDRIGGGDGFASGLSYGLISGRSPKRRCGSAGHMARS
jgi:2-dehydro-3-deoxygluconokinase